MDLENNPITYVFNLLGSIINGAIQVFTDFLNLIIDIVPNPDPFPEMIANMPDRVILDHGFFLYWVEQLIGVTEANMLIVNFMVLWVASLTFALVYKVSKFIKA